MIADRRTLDLIAGLPVEVQHTEAGGRLVDQPSRRNLERDLMVRLLDGLSAHDDHATLLALARDKKWLGKRLALSRHDRCQMHVG